MERKTNILKSSSLFFSCCFILLGQLLFSQNSWKLINQTFNSRVPAPLAKENYFELLDSKASFLFSTSKNDSFEILLPNENGKEELFLLKPVALLSPSLSKKYISIKTFKGKSVKRPNVKVRMSTHPNGINAWIQLEGKEDLFIQPVKGKKKVHFVYQKIKNDKALDFYCKTILQTNQTKGERITQKSTPVFSELRTFRIAIAGTAEYTNFWGDNDFSNGSNAEDAFGAVVSSLNRISQVFEDEVGVRLELVSDASLMYEDAENDPFSEDVQAELQETLDEVLGDEAYDVGHLFDYGEPNGDAGCIGCVCQTNQKGQGFSTHPFEDTYGGEFRNDYFDLDYAGHEIGHQFGAYHTFSFQNEGRGFNAEPGSGSTIMAYAGITVMDDVQLHGDPYFHYYSIQNIRNVVDQLSCGTSETIFQDTFTIDAGPNQLIPIGTPYELSIPALEGENITYCWEQLDSGEITSDNFGPYNALGSMTRSLPPTSVPNRSIPNLNQILSNSLIQVKPRVGDSWETVSLVGRKMKWGLSVRKNLDDYVQVAQDYLELTVVPTTSPFYILSQESPSLVWKGGSYQTIEWNVAETNAPPFRIDAVEISLSTDGGKTFPIQLTESTDNIGKAEVFVPNNIDTTNARIKVKAKGGIFFAINSVDFSIESRDLILNFEKYEQEICDSDSVQFDFTIERKANFETSFSLELEELPEGIQAAVSKSTFSNSEDSGTIIFSGLNGIPYQDYLFSLKAIFGSTNEPFSVRLKYRGSIQTPPAMLFPSDDSVEQSLRPLLSWESSQNIDTSTVQLALDANFENVVLESTSVQSQLQLAELEASQTYFWRVKGENGCGASEFANPFSFTTNSVTCVDVRASNLPKVTIDATNTSFGTIISSIEVNYDLKILDLDIFVDIEHPYIEDIALYLEAPEGSRYLLTSELGGDGQDYTNTVFDEEATVTIDNASPPFTGSFKPLQSIQSLYGTSSAGSWKLIVEDRYMEDTGRLLAFKISFCLEGKTLPNQDQDTIVDELDNCPEITNQDQSDIDNNGIGDVCDLFSSQNITISKNDASCPDKSNGGLRFSALADFSYKAIINSDTGYQKTLNFTAFGNSVSNLAQGLYSICIYVEDFPDYEYCFQTQISSPEPLEVLTFFNQGTSLLDIDLSGSSRYWIALNDQPFYQTDQKQLTLPLTQKINRLVIKTDSPCQGIFEQWINGTESASVFPNPIQENATLVLPVNAVVQLNLLTGSGKTIWGKQHNSNQGNTVQIPMGTLNSGLYLLQIEYPNRVETLKLLKR